MLNPEIPKCHEGLITLSPVSTTRKTMNNKCSRIENINIFGHLGPGGGGWLQ